MTDSYSALASAIFGGQYGGVELESSVFRRRCRSAAAVLGKGRGDGVGKGLGKESGEVVW